MMHLTVSRILHAGYLFECGAERVLFDPVFESPFSRNCFSFPAVWFDEAVIRRERFSAVFISHYHDDHCSFLSLDLIDRDTPIFMYCVHEEMFGFLRALGFTRVFALTLGEAVTVGGFQITPWRALDEDVDALFEITAGGLRVLNVVDAWIGDDEISRLASLGPWDLVLWPFQTMRESAVLAPGRAEPAARTVDPEVLEQLRALAPRYVVPSSCQFTFESWSWYRRAFFPISYARFAADVEGALPAQVVRLEPGDVFRLDAHEFAREGRLPWVRSNTNERVDYDFDDQLQPPSTAEVARRLAELTAGQRSRVEAFCRAELVARLAALDPVTALDWRLSIFDHLGGEQRYEFRLENSQAIPARFERPTWITEVPAVTLFGALEQGESLSSMYVRIDDCGNVEMDLLEDPLLRALFNGAFGAYQRAQLRALGRTRQC